MDIVEIIAAMIYSTESDMPRTAEEIERLQKLALQIHCRMPAMRRAFKDLLSS